MQAIPRSSRGTILVGEDEPEVRKYLEMALRCHGYDSEFGEDGNEVVSFLRNSHRTVAAVLLDIIMPRKDGLQALREIRKFNQDLPIIVLSSAFSPVQVVEAMKSGATDFLAKPITHEDLCTALQRVLNESWQKAPAASSQPDVKQAEPVSMVGMGKSGLLMTMAKKVAQTEIPVLIQGETGTGKEVMARYLHANSPRANKPFLKLNCAALPSELVESELFGYERGAFTGAFQKKVGMFEQADGGTLLLDEIGDMDFKLQAKLLQVLQDQTFQHLGGKEAIKVDVRVIAATHRNLEQAIVAGNFREDLYYRLNVMTLQIPALRDRRDELVPLAEMLMRRHGAAGGAMPPLPEELIDAMVDYDWPGNVRELENFVRRYLLFLDAEAAVRELRQKTIQRRGTPILKRDLPVEVSGPVADLKTLERVSLAKEQAEKETILSALHVTRWNRKQAALDLGIEYKALLYKMKKLGIESNPGVKSDRPWKMEFASAAAASAGGDGLSAAHFHAQPVHGD